MLFFVGHIFPYAALVVFVMGMTWRTAGWLRRPVPFPLALDPFPAGAATRVAVLAKELLLFSSLLKGDRRLWLLAGLMHASLAAIVLGHVVGISSLGQQFTILGASPESSTAMSKTLGVLVGLLFVASVFALLRRRRTVSEVRRLSAAADYFDLTLLLAIAATGLLMRLAPVDFDLAAVRAYIGSVLVLRPTDIPDQSLFIVHFVLVGVLLVYFPFSKLVHVTGGVVSRALIGPPARTQRLRRASLNAGEAAR